MLSTVSKQHLYYFKVSYDPTDYIQKARVTRALPPKPAYDPLQFVQLKPCSLVKTAQEQMKKVDVVKKIKDEKKEEPEEWQCVSIDRKKPIVSIVK